MQTCVSSTCVAGAIVLLAFASSASASGPSGANRQLSQQDARPATGPPVALTDLVNEALARNRELQALRRQIDVARQRPAQARALDPPMAEATIWQWPLNTLDPATNTNMYMFMLGQQLPGRGKRDLRVAIAEKDIALAEADVTIRAQQIVRDVRQAYAALFIARKAIDVHRASVELLRQIADASQAKYATGARMSQQDVLKPIVELSKLHAEIITLDEQAGIALARLNVLLDRPPDAAIGPLIEPDDAMPLPATEDLQRIAIERQPELQRARLEVERAEAELASARREYAPDFSVQGGYMLLPNQTDGLLARIGVTWPKAPWSRGKIDARISEHTAAADAARARAHAMETNVRLAVHEAWLRAKSAQARAAILRTTIVPQSQHTLELSRVAYQTDRVDFQTLIDNERMLLDAQLACIHALSDFTIATADLDRAAGISHEGK
jgi:cobalt-zinc-cadmium efflux system outer membrane protein